MNVTNEMVRDAIFASDHCGGGHFDAMRAAIEAALAKAPRPRRIVQLWTSSEGTDIALASDGTAWWWDGKEGWKGAFGPLPTVGE